MISVRNSVGRGNQQMRLTIKYWISFDLRYVSEVNKKTITESKQVLVIFTAHGFICKGGNILNGGSHSVQSPSRDVWISRLLVVKILMGCLSTQTNVKLCRTASHHLQQTHRIHAGKFCDMFPLPACILTAYHLIYEPRSLVVPPFRI